MIVARTPRLREVGAEALLGGPCPQLNAAQRREIVESVLSGGRTAAAIARLYAASQPTVSRIVAEARATG